MHLFWSRRLVLLESSFAISIVFRRIVGIAHVEDFESIQSPDIRAACEQRALFAAKKLMKERRLITSINQLFELIGVEFS
jgi:5-methylthioribose kinase